MRCIRLPSQEGVHNPHAMPAQLLHQHLIIVLVEKMVQFVFACVSLLQLMLLAGTTTRCPSRTI